MEHEKILQGLADTVVSLDADRARGLTSQALREGVPPLSILEDGLAKGLEDIGAQFAAGEAFLPELLEAAQVFQSALELVTPALVAADAQPRKVGRLLIGTVHGDIHDMGKNIVSSLAQVAGFEVFDLGVDVPVSTFVEKTRELQPNVLGMSAMLTTTQQVMPAVIQALKEAGLRDKVKVIVGGAPVNHDWARQIGADAYGADATDAVARLRELVRPS
jgi:corrinoid protein of di/trimethylamine methyltransferase